MLRKPAHFIFYFSTLQKPAAGAGFCNVLKYKDDTFYLSTIQKPAPDPPIIIHHNMHHSYHDLSTSMKNIV